MATGVHWEETVIIIVIIIIIVGVRTTHSSATANMYSGLSDDYGTG